MRFAKDSATVKADVVIVGLGPVGATLAGLLGRHGVDTLVLEAAGEVGKLPRAISLDNDALRILQLAGIPEGAFPTTIIPYVQMRSPIFGAYARGNTMGRIDGHPKLVTFYQPDLEAALRVTLARHRSVRVETGVRVMRLRNEAEGVHLVAHREDGSTFDVTAKYAVGCDGAASFVRNAAGLDFEGESYPQDWLVADVRNAAQPIDHVEFWCDPARPSPRMPAPGDRQRWEFMLRPGETRAQMEREEVARELMRLWTNGAHVEIERLAVYRFHARIVERFSVGRVFLAGDAAHVTPPFAGQGLSSGLRDAANLGWKLAWVLRGRAAPDILASYDVERRAHAAATIDLARFMGRMIMPRNMLSAFAVHGAMRVIDLLPPTRRLFRDLEIKPKNRFARGLFVRRRFRERLTSGSTFPQGVVKEGERIRLSDEVLGAKLCLVGLGVDPTIGLGARTQARWLFHGGQLVHIHRRWQGDEGASVARRCEDVDGTFVPSAAPPGWVAVVRPDNTVMCEGPASEVTRLADAALSLLRASS